MYKQQKQALDLTQKINPFSGNLLKDASFIIAMLGVLLLFYIGFAGLIGTAWLSLLFSVGLITIGTTAYFFIDAGKSPEVGHNGRYFSSMQTRGWIGWGAGIIFTAFYVAIYWHDHQILLPHVIQNWTRMTEPLSQLLRNTSANHWFLYSFFYSMAVLIMGGRFLIKFRHSRHHIIRTISVIFFQLILAFILPAILVAFKQPEFYFTYFWPLRPEYLFPSTLGTLTQQGALAQFMAFWSVGAILIATPVLTYFYGKRWYCSWVCGCGGLAETAGDPYRHLSDNSLRAWQIERYMVHGMLVIIVLVTALLWASNYFPGTWLGSASQHLKEWYGFYIGSIFSGVIGVGFYPLLGNRVWCRYGCPMAAILGIQQKFFSRFRITTNGGQCISCGNCNTYCEMGIDVKWYAQRQQNIVRASCVGCGICATVCPRGVLKLENGTRDQSKTAIQITKSGVRVDV